MLYAVHGAAYAASLSALVTVLNAVGNALLMSSLGAIGLAISTSATGCMHTLLLMIVLSRCYHVTVSVKHLARFLFRHTAHLIIVALPCVILGYSAQRMVLHSIGDAVSYFGIANFSVWIWAAPVIGIYFLLLFGTRRYAGVKIHYLG